MILSDIIYVYILCVYLSIYTVNDLIIALSPIIAPPPI